MRLTENGWSDRAAAFAVLASVLLGVACQDGEVLWPSEDGNLLVPESASAEWFDDETVSVHLPYQLRVPAHDSLWIRHCAGEPFFGLELWTEQGWVQGPQATFCYGTEIHDVLVDGASVLTGTFRMEIHRENWRFGSTTRLTILASSAPPSGTETTRLKSNPFVVRR